MSTGYKIVDTGEQLYYLTFQIVEWVDLFTRPCYRDIILESMEYCIKSKGLIVYSYVIMSNHVHVIVKSSQGDLSEIIRDFKKFTSKQIIKQIEEGVESRREWVLNIFKQAAEGHTRNTNYQVWTHENHAEYLYSNQFIAQKLEYIHQNPVRAGLVRNPEDYLYSSAIDYAGGKGMLNIEIIYQRWKSY